MSARSLALAIMTALLFTALTPAAAFSAATNTSSLWRANPFYAFVFSDLAMEDRNGDGKPDLWREFYHPGGPLRQLKFDTQLNTGRPNLIYTYSEDGRLERREETDNATGETTITVFEGDTIRVTQGSRIETIESLPGGTQVHRIHDGKLHWTWQQGDDSQSNQAMYSTDPAPENSFTQCLKKNGELAPTDIDEILLKLEDRITLDPKCEAGGLTKKRIVQLATSGVKCMVARGGQARRFAEEMLANAFATGKPPLQFNCNKGFNAEHANGCKTGSGGAAAMASTFGDKDWPRVWVDPAVLAGQKPAAQDTILFHEMLHLGGHQGCQHLHNYSDARQTETVEPCAQCCSNSIASIKKTDCDLCDGKYKPSEHALRYAATETGQQVYGVAQKELTKAVLLSPGSREAWSALADVLARRSNDLSSEDHDLFFTALLKLKAFRRLCDGADTSKCNDTSAASPVDPDYKKKLEREIGADFEQTYGLEQDRALDAASGGLADSPSKIAYLGMVRDQTMVKLTLQSCGPMLDAGSGNPALTAEQAHAVHCHQLNNEFLSNMQSDLETLKGNPKVSKSLKTSLEDRLAQFKIWTQCQHDGLLPDACGGKGLKLKKAGPGDDKCPRSPDL